MPPGLATDPVVTSSELRKILGANGPPVTTREPKKTFKKSRITDKRTRGPEITSHVQLIPVHLTHLPGPVLNPNT